MGESRIDGNRFGTTGMGYPELDSGLGHQEQAKPDIEQGGLPFLAVMRQLEISTPSVSSS